MMIKCYDNLSEVFFSDQKQKSEDISYSCETLDWYFFFFNYMICFFGWDYFLKKGKYVLALYCQDFFTSTFKLKLGNWARENCL